MRRVIASTMKYKYKVPNWLLGLPSEEEQDKELDEIIAQITPPKTDYKIRHGFMRWVLLGLTGRECTLCGSKEKLDFHHKDKRKRKKSEYFNQRLGHCSDNYFWNKIVPEVMNECILLCRKCHLALHRKKINKKR